MDDDPTNERKTYAGTDLLVTCFGEWIPLPQTNDFKIRLKVLTLRCIEVQKCRHAFETPMQFLIASHDRGKRNFAVYPCVSEKVWYFSK